MKMAKCGRWAALAGSFSAREDQPSTPVPVSQFVNHVGRCGQYRQLTMRMLTVDALFCMFGTVLQSEWALVQYPW